MKTTSHKYLLVFYPKTEVKTLSEKDFPNFKFDLKSFLDLQSQSCLNDQLLIDVIGKIVGRSKVQTYFKRGGEEKLMEITLEDHEGNRLACTLWGEYVEKFLNCVTQGVPGPFILLLSFCKPRRYQGTVTVSTSFHVTKMIFDGNSDEVNQFRNSLPLQVDDISYSMEKNVAKSQIKAQFEKKRSNLGRSPNPTLMKLAQPPLFIPIQRKRENEVSVSKSMSSVDQIQDAPTTLLLLRSSLNAATERNSQREERLGL